MLPLTPTSAQCLRQQEATLLIHLESKALWLTPAPNSQAMGSQPHQPHAPVNKALENGTQFLLTKMSTLK